MFLARPAVLAPVLEHASALVATFGISPKALLEVLFGDDRPRGTLPFDVPSSMDAVRASRPDVPFDTADPTFRFGFGLTYR